MTPVRVGLFDESDRAVILKKLPGVTFSSGAKSELENWSAGYPPLYLALLNQIKENGAAREIDNQVVNQAAKTVQDGVSSIIHYLWNDCPETAKDIYRHLIDHEESPTAGVGHTERALLEEKGFIYRDDETLWFKTTDFGDDKDRVVVRKNGDPTYFAADIAYHKNKYERGFDTVIDIWGADHHGYIPRMHAGIQALGHSRDALRVVLVQLVNLLRDGKPVAMSTRSGEFVTMKEVVEEVGRDAARYNFLMRRSDSHLDFDLELAKKQSNENPVYYVQYAHARICSILRMAQERGIEIPASGEADPQLLRIPEEIALIKALIRFPEIVEGSVRTLEPHRITFYLNDLAGMFHSYYNKYKVISEDDATTKARLFLMKCIAVVLNNALTLLGVSAPEKM